MHQHQHIYIQNTVVRTHLSLYHHHHNAYIHQNNLQFIQRQRQPTLTAAADGIMNGSLNRYSQSLQICICNCVTECTYCMYVYLSLAIVWTVRQGQHTAVPDQDQV